MTQPVLIMLTDAVKTMEVREEHDLSRSPVFELYNTTEHNYKFRIMQVKSNNSG